jgi:hypothetical protein
MPKSVRTKSIVCGINWTNLPWWRAQKHVRCIRYQGLYQSLVGAPDDKGALKEEEDLPPAARGREGNLSLSGERREV